MRDASTLFVYILFSSTIRHYYVGMSSNIERRVAEHRSSKGHWTGQADDWIEVWRTAVPTREDARHLERKIKARGAKRFLEDMATA